MPLLSGGHRRDGGQGPSAHDVAREIRRRLPGVGSIKVHKLLYYCQGWHLVLAGRPMFEDPIAAFVNGPVAVDLWHDEKNQRSLPPAAELDHEQSVTLDYVLARYSSLSWQELVSMTHDESPWRSIAECEELGSAPAPIITQSAMRQFFDADVELVAARERADRVNPAEFFGPLPLTEEDIERLLLTGDASSNL